MFINVLKFSLTANNHFLSIAEFLFSNAYIARKTTQLNNFNIVAEYRYHRRRLTLSFRACNFVLAQLILNPNCDDSSFRISSANTRICSMLDRRDTSSAKSRSERTSLPTVRPRYPVDTV